MKAIMIDVTQNSLASTLESHGYDLCRFCSLEEATPLIRSEAIPLIICSSELLMRAGSILRTITPPQVTSIIAISDHWPTLAEYVWMYQVLGVRMIITSALAPDVVLSLLHNLVRQAPIATAPTLDVTRSSGTVHCQDGTTQEQFHKVSVAVAEKQAELRLEIANEWALLKNAVARLEQDPDDYSKREELQKTAHRLVGSAGSLGLSLVSKAAGKIEDFLQLFSVESPADQIVWISAINRAVEEGESSLSVVSPEFGATPPARDSSCVLIVTDNAVIANQLAVQYASSRVVKLDEGIRVFDRLEHYEPNKLIVGSTAGGVSGADIIRLLREDSQWKGLDILQVQD